MLLVDTAGALRRTPLFDAHVALGGRMVSFAGWEMPIQYTGILEESRAVRSGAGLFDVSHMGRLDIEGSGAAELLNGRLSVDVPAMRIGRARYNLVCNEEGGIIDDCVVYRRADDRFLLIPNAANSAAVLDWITADLSVAHEAEVTEVTSSLAMIAHQGPRAADVLSGLTSAELESLRPFSATETEVAGAQAFLARTGYTGEDGFEIIVPSEAAESVWRALMERGAVPCGLGSRDVLRLEAGLLLHGSDMDTSTNPYEAGLERFVNPDRDGYVAGPALRRVRDDGVARRIVGFNMVGRGIPRHGYAITDGSGKIGEVTSGGHSPSLDRSIGLGYVPTAFSPKGSRFHVDIRGRAVEAEVTDLPFYSRKRRA